MPRVSDERLEVLTLYGEDCGLTELTELAKDLRDLRAQKAKDDADYAAAVRALHGLVWKCHVADCNEDLGDVDFSDEWNMLARCEECDGHGTKDKLPHEDESIEPENVCPACGGMVILPVLAPARCP